MAQARTSDPKLRNYTHYECKGYNDYLEHKEEYDKYDVVYSAEWNVGTSHYFTIYKQPSGLTDWEVACIIDGCFYNVIRHGNTLDCWWD